MLLAIMGGQHDGLLSSGSLPIVFICHSHLLFFIANELCCCSQTILSSPAAFETVRGSGRRLLRLFEKTDEVVDDKVICRDVNATTAPSLSP